MEDNGIVRDPEDKTLPVSESEMDQQLGYTAVRLNPARSRPAKVECWFCYTGKSIFPSSRVCRRAHSGLLESQQRRRVLSERPVQELKKSSTLTTAPKDHGVVSVFGVRRDRVILNQKHKTITCNSVRNPK